MGGMGQMVMVRDHEPIKGQMNFQDLEASGIHCSSGAFFNDFQCFQQEYPQEHRTCTKRPKT